MDFSRLGGRGVAKPLTDPRDIFNALPGRTADFPYLRDPQGQVLEAWYARREEHDLVIKMNTGAGKTAVGLLALQSCLNEGRGPALYVVPSRYLAEEFVPDQAASLGVAVTDLDSTAYRSGHAIAIVTVEKLFNGRSVFGGPGNTRIDPVSIGSLVIDDAHAAIAAADAQTTVVLPNAHPAYQRIRDLFETDLRQQSETTLLDIDAGVPSALMRIPFWAWSDHEADVATILHAHREDDEIKFTFPMIAGLLSICTAIITASQLEIRPALPPIDSIEGFAAAKRRIYLTATLADDGVLVSDFAASAASVRTPITPATAADIGDRMILAPQEINPAIEDEDLRQALRKLADDRNVVVLVPSHRRAEHWVNVADITAAADTIGPTVDRLNARHVGLVVLVNKYDGIDLPGDACRVLVIDGLPAAYSGFDRREAVALGESEAMSTRQIQRIEQGMGRGVRSSDDYCFVLLLGARLAQLVADPRYVARFSPATRAQIALSREVAAELGGGTLDRQLVVMGQMLARDPGWLKVSRATLAGVAYDAVEVATDVIERRAAFDAARIGQFAVAIEAERRALNAITEPRTKGWFQEELAMYQQQVDAAGAQQTLAGAIRLNPRVLRPLRGVTYERLTPAGNQAQEAAAFLGAEYGERNRFLVGIYALLDALVFDPGRTDEFESAMERLATHLGLRGHRPERDAGNGPDLLWSLGPRRYLIIECKSGSRATQISRRDVEQLGHSILWFEREYADFEYGALIVHPATVTAHDAIAPRGARVMTPSSLGDLTAAVRRISTALADAGGWRDAAAVGDQLRLEHLVAGDIIDRFSVPIRSSRRR